MLKEVDVVIPGLPRALNNFRIVQISDLHIGTTIRRSYVEKVVAQTNGLQPDLIALTGDMVDGSVEDLREHALPLQGLKATYGSYLCLGNHDYYSGSQAWVKFWTDEVGLCVLRNEHVICKVSQTGENAKAGSSRIMVAGVTDPASRLEGPGKEPDPAAALATPHPYQKRASPPSSADTVKNSGIDLHLMLAHNPKLAAAVAKSGFDLQLSGHTHAGQFLPWTWATKLIHAPHYAGLSREGRSLQVYVNAGTGSWGPPLRFGTSTELTLLRLVPAD
jgi:predicted MPP superfamily phosphohydrolase